MGGGNWSPADYYKSSADRKAKGQATFGHDAAVKSGAANAVHDSLNPAAVAGPTSQFAGKPIRESRDSDEHPQSLPIAIIFDVTGSMGGIPVTLQTKLPKLMDVVIAKAGVAHPQVLVGAIGDATCDTFPLQIGQFESDNRFEENLRNIILEGHGGGQRMESYALAYKFAADHTDIDSFNKRGRRGYLFTMGDEAPWPTVTAEQVSRLFGVTAEKDETVEQLIARAQEKWNIYHLRALDGSYRDDTEIQATWHKLLGERVVPVEDSSLVCEIIAGIIHSNEAACDLQQTVKDLGVTGRDAKVVTNALVQVTKATQIAGAADGNLPANHPAMK